MTWTLKAAREREQQALSGIVGLFAPPSPLRDAMIDRQQLLAILDRCKDELSLAVAWVDHEEIGSSDVCTDRCPACRLERVMKEMGGG